MEKIQHKKGDTFFVTCTYTLDGTTPETLVDIDIYSQVRLHSGKLVDTLQVTKLDGQTGKYEVQAATDTWPLEALLWDIKYIQNDIIYSTETFIIDMQSLITENPEEEI